VYELPLQAQKSSAGDEEEAVVGGDDGQKKKALVFCDLITNVTEGPLNVRMLGIVTGGKSPRVPWMPRYMHTHGPSMLRCTGTNVVCVCGGTCACVMLAGTSLCETSRR
jgi:hypothetical protein